MRNAPNSKVQKDWKWKKEGGEEAFIFQESMNREKLM